MSAVLNYKAPATASETARGAPTASNVVGPERSGERLNGAARPIAHKFILRVESEDELRGEDDDCEVSTFDPDADISALSKHVFPAIGPKAKNKRDRFRVLRPKEMRSLPEPSWQVGVHIPLHGIVVMYGPPGSYKTFLLLEILLSIASGQKCFGALSVKQGAAILCAGEGPFSIARKRWPAWAEARGIKDIDSIPFGLVPCVPHVAEATDIDALIEAIRKSGLKPTIVAIDTAARAMVGLDENSAKDMGFLVAAAERLRLEFSCTVLIVHHSGKDTARGARGSNALIGGVDAIFEVEANRATLTATLRCHKQKDGDEPEPIHLWGKRVAESLVFDQIDGSKTAPVRDTSPQVVAQALRDMGCIANAKACSIAELATQILTMRNKLPRDPEKVTTTIKNLQNRLIEAVKSDAGVAAYARKEGGHPTAAWRWRVFDAEIGGIDA